MTVMLKGVRVVTAGRPILSGVNVSIAAGEHVALIGPSGAGKTTLLNLLAGALAPSEGEVVLFGQNPWRLPARQAQQLRARIGLAPQQPPLPARQRVITSVLAGRLGQWSTWQAVRSWLAPADPEGARQALQQVGLESRLYDPVEVLSGGERQRVMLARVLYQAPPLVVLDEPVSALDPYLARRTVAGLVADARKRGATLVASLHAVDLATACFARVIGLRGGEVVFDLPADQVQPALLGDLYGKEAPVPAAAPFWKPGLSPC